MRTHLLNIIPRSDIDEHVLHIYEPARDVKGTGERHQNGFISMILSAGWRVGGATNKLYFCSLV